MFCNKQLKGECRRGGYKTHVFHIDIFTIMRTLSNIILLAYESLLLCYTEDLNTITEECSTSFLISSVDLAASGYHKVRTASARSCKISLHCFHGSVRLQDRYIAKHAKMEVSYSQ